MISKISLVLSVFLLLGIAVPTYAQTTDHVVINEVDINPPGDDAASVSEWVELFNPTDSGVDLGGWKIASTTVLKKTMTIPDGTIMGPGEFLTYSYQSVWFTDSNESVELRDENGIVIDKTPLIADIQNDFTSWQRLYDGFDSDSADDWKFVTSTAGSSNGKLVDAQDSEQLTVTVSSEKSSYLFGDVAVIRGSVSEEVFTVKPFFQPQPITVTVDGPNFNKIINLYPDLNLNFKTTLSLHQVLGINEGNYDVSVNYAGVDAHTSFSVGYELIEQTEKEDSSLSILTDKSQYIPGQSVSITGYSSEIIPFEGMKLKVTDSRGDVISSGTLYPSSGEFTTSLFITTIDPGYGTYEIYAEYFDKSASTSFEVVEDIKEDVPISLWTDKVVYGLGEEVTISGRLNQVWVGFLDLEILQTKQFAIGSTSDSGFKIQDGVRMLGDGSFSYTFTIPDNSLRLGDYRITVSKDIGSASTIIHVSSNPEEFVIPDEKLSLSSDKSIYDLGDVITISGFIKDPFGNSSYKTGTPVKISIYRDDGTQLEITGVPKGTKRSTTGGVSVAYDFTAIPESSGNFSLSVDVSKSIFSEGNYIIKAEYLGDIATHAVSIVDSLDLEGAIFSLDKDVYGLGETVHLTGILPPTGENSIDISLTKPDGTRSDSGAFVDNQRFSWTWTTPISEKYQNVKVDDKERDVVKSNFGVYKIQISMASKSQNLFFKVSPDPQNDSLSTTPIFVTTEKPLYKAGEKLKVLGNVIKREQGDEGLVVPERVTIKVLDGSFPFKQLYESSVYPTQGGDFSSLFELPATIFSEGGYTVKANYRGIQAETTFSVTNDFVFGSDEELSLLLSTDKPEYHPGDIVLISGKPNKLIYLEKFDVGIVKITGNAITCGSFICGKNSGPVTTILPSPSGSFSHQFVIPDSDSSIGSYKVTVDADFETKSIQFDVVEKPSIPKLDTIIEKENRISEQTISITSSEKTLDGEMIAPRVISGSLITPTRGDESAVNLKVSSNSGVCIIGPDADCLVGESTRKPGQIYDVVEVDGMSLNVRYSGPDVRLEKFSILPESSTAFLPDTNWSVKILKDDQVSRFYYKVTYKSLE
ncbi:MAG: lamin tail domain-containing protein [Nitrosopumilus sp.]